MEIRPALWPEDLARTRELFREYAGTLGFDLSFQDFERELEDLPGSYASPHGTVLLAMDGDTAVGCVALRPLEPGIGEMKRLYVRPAGRRAGIGKRLVAAVLDEARLRGFRSMRLDTVPGMDAAIALYRSHGFREIGPYRSNPIPGALYMEMEL